VCGCEWLGGLGCSTWCPSGGLYSHPRRAHFPTLHTTQHTHHITQHNTLQVRAAIDTIQEGLGPLPLLPPEADEETDDTEVKGKDGTTTTTTGAGARTSGGASAGAVGSKRPAVLADGTYATQTAVETALPATSGAGAVPSLRALLLGGDFFLGGVVSAAITKLVLRLRALGVPRAAANRASAQGMLCVASILRLGEWSGLPSPLDDDSRERMAACLDVLARPEPEMVKLWLDDCRNAFTALTADKQSREAAALAAESAKTVAQPDDLIDFSHLRARKVRAVVRALL